MAVIATVVLLLLNGFFVAAEFAFVAARPSVFRDGADRGSRLSRMALGITDRLSDALAGAQLGITMASLGLGFVAEPAIAHHLERGIGVLAPLSAATAHAIAIPIALAIVVYFHMVIGEMVPKNIAIAGPERASLALALPFRIYMATFSPLIRLLNFLANGVIRVFGVDPVASHHASSSGEDLAFVISVSRRQGFIHDIEHRMLTGALTFSNRDAAEAMIPRTDVIAAPSSITPAELERLCNRTGHSRIPIHEGDLDTTFGFVHIKDLLAVPRDQRNHQLDPDLIRPILAIPESAHLDTVLLAMRRNRAHLALVVDEHGGAAGIVTLEDVVEELVGEIRDEHDLGLRRVVTLGPDRFRFPGMLRLDEVRAEISLSLPQGEYDTVGGYIMDALGRVPEPGDVVELGNWRLQVKSLDGRRVDVVEAHRSQSPQPQS